MKTFFVLFYRLLLSSWFFLLTRVLTIFVQSDYRTKLRGAVADQWRKRPPSIDFGIGSYIMQKNTECATSEFNGIFCFGLTDWRRWKKSMRYTHITQMSAHHIVNCHVLMAFLGFGFFFFNEFRNPTEICSEFADWFISNQKKMNGFWWLKSMPFVTFCFIDRCVSWRRRLWLRVLHNHKAHMFLFRSFRSDGIDQR